MFANMKVFALSLASLAILGVAMANAKDGADNAKLLKLRPDLAAKKLYVKPHGSHFHLHGIITNLGKGKYFGGRTYKLAMRRTSGWVTLKHGPIPALKMGKMFEVDVRLQGKPAKGMVFRLDISPGDGNPANDHKILIIP